MNKQIQTTNQLLEDTGKLFIFTREDIQATASVQVPVDQPSDDTVWAAIKKGCSDLAPMMEGTTQVMTRVIIGKDALGLMLITVEAAPAVHNSGQYKYVPENEMDEIDEAARQLSAIHGISQRKAAETLVQIGIEIGKLKPGSRIRGMGEPKPCRQCGTPTRHKKGFCSGDCCRMARTK